jgi:hypothetical protein
VHPIILRGLTYRNFFGTVLLIDSAEVVLENCHFINSTSGTAPTIIVRNRGKLTIINSKFDENVNLGNQLIDGSGRGGFMYLRDSDVEIIESEIKGSRASQGGAIFLDSGSVLNLKNVLMKHNGAVQGGAIFAVGSQSRSGQSTLVGSHV